MPIHDIFEKMGESHFRALEREVLQDFIMGGDPGMVVIAAGGGLPRTVDTIRLIKERGFVVYLKSSIDDIMKRVEKSSERPVFHQLQSDKNLSKLLTEREQFYSMADISIENRDGVPPWETAQKIAHILKRKVV
jgi:shikimate kinase